MESTRRTFVKNGALIASGAAFAKLSPRELTASPLESKYGHVDAGWKMIIQHGLDVAKSSGASYADIRMTFTRERSIDPQRGVTDKEAIHCGIRCLMNGYWGFASSPVVGKTEMTRLAHEAAAQAKANALGKSRTVELAKAPVVSSGQWTMPVQIDPFDVHPLDGDDLIRGLIAYGKNIGLAIKPGLGMVRQDKAFGSMDGSYFTQRVFRTQANGIITYQRHSRAFDPYSWAGVGWELFEPIGMRAHIDAMHEEMKEDDTLGRKMVDVGRYPMVLDAQSVAGVLASTIGLATELDRALGYEANATGTSYLNDPDEMVETHKIGTPLLTVAGNRNAKGGVATVQWDDDGVVPEPFELVREGVLQRFQTTRESAHWIRATSAQGGTVKSTGCAQAATGVDAPITRSANLDMAPANDSTNLQELYRDVKSGVLFRSMGAGMDFQQLNGFGIGAACYEITNGKRTAMLANAGVLFRAPELWKGLLGIGGTQTVGRYGLDSDKGQPEQKAYHSVSAVPALFENATIIDYTRKA